ncbi:imidazolonepropionase [Alkalicaulis satelles]|uniref:Imidazolonepropionase n=1 Tax=Alkalicaulis satelles TaxID=2609175 RepID=A0A5M6ZGE3_9PROT|nr:imidazolonepropionase [Alkalicaulis satelles]KAA5803360.1 imidazolonepropionase [Alkalicaulis satelles]
MTATLFHNACAATLDPAREGVWGVVEPAAILSENGRITWIGPESDLPSQRASGAERIDLGGRWVTPALIDCHTHLVFAGDRSGEFEQRLSGVSYEEIARAGGGIRATMTATRAASLEALTDAAEARIRQLMRGGVASVEIKSGYGLDMDTERAMLMAATEAARRAGVRVRRTFLGLHALPPDYQGRRADYVRWMAGDVLPALHAEGLVDAVDAFCETIGFTPAETELMFEAAARLGLPVCLHAEQLSDQGGAALAARYGALSADHLEYLSEAGAQAMAQAGTTAVLLPGAFYALKETKRPPVDLLRALNVPMAVATDLNPGSSPLVSPVLAMNMACILFGLTPAEAFAGMTRDAAKAMGVAGEAGMLRAGLAADLAVWDVSGPAEIVYWIGHPGPERLFIAGQEASL